MAKRVISGIAIFLIIVAAGFAGKQVLFFLTLFCSLCAVYEYCTAVKLSTKETFFKEPLSVMTLALCVLYYAVIFLNSVVYIRRIVYLNPLSLMAVLMLISVIAYMSVYVFAFPKYNLEQIAKAHFGFVYTSLMMSTIYLVYDIEGIGFYLYWLIFISASICDVCAYFVGINFGKHKLAPVLSPKKSIEGSLGGVLGSALAAFIYGYVIIYMIMGLENHTLLYVIVCTIASVVSQVGDLAASAIKRNSDIKDFSKLIPGHGGILDRLDSCLFTAPVIYIAAYFVVNLF